MSCMIKIEWNRIRTGAVAKGGKSSMARVKGLVPHRINVSLSIEGWSNIDMRSVQALCVFVLVLVLVLVTGCGQANLRG